MKLRISVRKIRVNIAGKQGASDRDVVSKDIKLRIGSQRVKRIRSYLHRFKREDKANCLACSEDFETSSHFLLDYPSYAFKRWALERQVKRKKKIITLETLLGDLDLALPLVNYIDRTERFKQLLG